MGDTPITNNRPATPAAPPPPAAQPATQTGAQAPAANGPANAPTAPNTASTATLSPTATTLQSLPSWALPPVPKFEKLPDGKTGYTDPRDIPEINAASKKVDDLKSKKEDADKQLNNELQRYGDALTPQQRTQYAAQFQKDHPVYAQYKQAQQDLADQMNAHQDALQSSFLYSENFAGARDEVMSLMAKTGDQGGLMKLNFATELLRNPDLAKDDMAAGMLQHGVIEPNLTNMAAALMGHPKEGGPDNKGGEGGVDVNPAEATEALKNSLGASIDSYNKALSALNKAPNPDMSGLGKGLDKLNDAFKAPDADFPGALKGATGELQDADKFGSASKALAGMGLALGALKIGGDLQKGDYGTAVYDFIKSGSDATFLAKSINQLAGRFEGLQSAAEVFGKVGGAFSAIEATVSLKKDLTGFFKDKDDKYALGAAVSQAAVIAGSVAAIVGTGGFAAAGIAVAAVGSLAGYVFEKFSDAFQDDKRNTAATNDANKYLPNLSPANPDGSPVEDKNARLDPNVAKAIANGGKGAIPDLRNQLGLSPSQIQDLVKQGYGDALLKGDGNTHAYLADVRMLLGKDGNADGPVDSAKAYGLLQSLGSQGGNPRDTLAHLNQAIGAIREKGGTAYVQSKYDKFSPEWWNEQLGRYADPKDNTYNDYRKNDPASAKQADAARRYLYG